MLFKQSLPFEYDPEEVIPMYNAFDYVSIIPSVKDIINSTNRWKEFIKSKGWNCKSIDEVLNPK